MCIYVYICVCVYIYIYIYVARFMMEILRFQLWPQNRSRVLRATFQALNKSKFLVRERFMMFVNGSWAVCDVCDWFVTVSCSWTLFVNGLSCLQTSAFVNDVQITPRLKTINEGPKSTLHYIYIYIYRVTHYLSISLSLYIYIYTHTHTWTNKHIHT